MPKLSQQLLVQAKHLAVLDRGKPQQANLRRAISASYYSVFHFLIEESVALFLGSTSKHKSLRDVLARAFDHGVMKSAASSFLQSPSGLPGVLKDAFPAATPSNEIKRCAKHFVELQQRRHIADYDPSHVANRAAVESDISRAEQLMTDWKTIRGMDEANAFLVAIFAWNRINRA